MDPLNEIIAILSTYTVLLPVAAGFFVYSKLRQWYRYLLFFLIFGFSVDLFCTFIDDSNHVFNFYRLAEGLFYASFLYHLSDYKHSKIIFISVFTSLILVYGITHAIVLENYDLRKLNAAFDMFSSIVLSFCAAAVMLQLTQRVEKLTKEPAFWFTTSIFIYFFCTNFLFSLIENRELLFKIWFLHNLINIITYLIDMKGFLSVKRISDPVT